MTYSEFVRRTFTVLGIIFTALLVWRAISTLLSIFLLVFTCWVLSIGLNAAIRRFQRMGLQRTTASLSVLLIIIIISLLIVTVIVPPFLNQISTLFSDLPAAVETIVKRYEEFWVANENLQRFLPQFTLQDYQDLIAPTVEEVVGEAGPTSRGSQGVAIDPGTILSSALPVLSGIGSFFASLLANLIFMILITAYLIADPLTYYRPFLAIVPKDHEDRVIQIINKIRGNIISWMGGVSVSIAFTAVTVSFTLGIILGIPNALALGVISGLGALIPNIGYYIGLIPIVIFSLADDPVKVIPAAVLYWLLNQIEGSIITPAVMKSELDIPPGVILPFQLAAAAIMGFFGILLSVPILAILVTLVREIYVVGWLDKGETNRVLKEDSFGNVYIDIEEENESRPATPVIQKP